MNFFSISLAKFASVLSKCFDFSCPILFSTIAWFVTSRPIFPITELTIDWNLEKILIGFSKNYVSLGTLSCTLNIILYLRNHEHCMSCSQSWVVVRKLSHYFLPVVVPSLFSFGFLSHTLWYMGSILRSRSKRNPLFIKI